MVTAAIISGVVGIGTALLNFFGSNKASSDALEAQKYYADALVESHAIDADAQIAASTKGSNAALGAKVLDYERQKYIADASQTGVLFVGLVIVSLIFIYKK